MVDARVVHSFKLRCFCVSFSVNRLFSEALLKCALLPPGTTHSYVLCSENHLVDHIQCDKWQDRTPPLISQAMSTYGVHPCDSACFLPEMGCSWKSHGLTLFPGWHLGICENSAWPRPKPSRGLCYKLNSVVNYWPVPEHMSTLCLIHHCSYDLRLKLKNVNTTLSSVKKKHIIYSKYCQSMFSEVFLQACRNLEKRGIQCTPF